MNYFELFGLPEQFSIDGGLLSSQFRVLQKQCHPDKFALGTEHERLLAVQKASEINDAFQVLKNPISRTEYILLLKGIDIRDESKTMQDSLFLIRQMELREELEDIELSHTIESDVESDLFDFNEKVSILYRELISQVESELSQGLWEPAATSVRKLKFMAKLKNEVARVEEKFLS